jgi:hypothetical protein
MHIDPASLAIYCLHKFGDLSIMENQCKTLYCYEYISEFY